MKQGFLLAMANCKLCEGKIETTFMGKIQGTILYDSKHKQQHVCPNCQKQHKNDLKDKIE
jgi:uncharacterized protein with PIN domain